MKVTQKSIWICPICKDRFDFKIRAEKCFQRCKRIQAFEKQFPEVIDVGCGFANGDGWIQRDKTWFDSYCLELENLLIKNHPSLKKDLLKYGLLDFIGRILDDSDFKEYHHWLRLSSVCKACYKEWGQPYYAINCLHDGTTKEMGNPKKKPRWIEPNKPINNPSKRFP